MKYNTVVSKKFDNIGYEVFPNLVPSELIEKLRSLFTLLMNSNDLIDKAITNKNGNKFVTNIANICNKGDLSCLALLGFSPILEIAEQICGLDFIMIQEFAVIKNLGDGLPVLWHQDMLNERKGKCFTMGIYLDDADENDGALCVIPESHLAEVSICEIMEQKNMQVPVKAGDVLIHDMMLAHKSDILTINKLRRVVYFEFLSISQVRAEKIYIEELIERRTKIIPIAIQQHKLFFPKTTPFEYKNSVTNDATNSIKETLEEIYTEHTRARPSAYCFNNFH